ncbi:MAG: SRPBCC family protein [Actinobacteria bacterium]|nr:SRPBCC family protein [Actinomycetota bacterium]
MLIENDFRVEAPAGEVYALMLDVERVATCMPGCEVLGQRDDGAYDGRMSVKLGPMKMKYEGTVAITAQDAAARSAVMLAKGVEARGQGSAQGTLTMSVAEAAPAAADVAVATDIKLTGRVAQMGQGIMRDVATKMVGEMAANMERLLAGGEGEATRPDAAGGGATGAAPPTPPPADSHVGAGTLLMAVIKGRAAALRNWFRQLRRQGTEANR